LQPAPSSFYSESRQQDIFTQKGWGWGVSLQD
jgi:hypothetical protein